MSISRLVVIGAAGDVGRGVTAAALDRGWEVSAVGRRRDVLDELAGGFVDRPISVVPGSVGDDDEAVALAESLDLGEGTSVVNAISVPWTPGPLLQTAYEDIASYFTAYLGAHLAAAKAFLPRLAAGSVYLGVGGGMADFVPRGIAPVSMSQAAERNLYRGLHAENKDAGVEIRELMVVSKVHGHSNRGQGRPEWLTAEEIGERICDVIADPAGEQNVGPILKLVPPER